jgi:glycosyltransferase involved in cell wall biosynthesis
MTGTPLTILLDRFGIAGGAERYWHILIPALREAGLDVRVLARTIVPGARSDAPLTTIAWGGDDGIPSAAAAAQVRAILRASGSGTVITASVFDPAVLGVVREESAHWIVRLHDHRTFCANGDRVFPQFDGICTHAAGWSCAIGALARGCMHGPRAASAGRLARRLALRDQVAGADAVLVSSNYMHASALANRIDPRRIVIMPPPLSDTAYARAVRPRPDRDVVLFSGRLTPQKGVTSLIRALARIAPERRPQLVVAGAGDDEHRARTLAERLAVAVEWRGWLGTHDLRAAIDVATIVAVPSLEPEPFGLVGIEAQARGRPAVAYDVGGIRDWIDGAGVAVPRADERALAAAILDVLDPARWNALSYAARRTSERYRLRPHLERMLDVIDARPLPCEDAATAVAAAMPVVRARPTPRSRAHPNRPTADRQSSG